MSGRLSNDPFQGGRRKSADCEEAFPCEEEGLHHRAEDDGGGGQDSEGATRRGTTRGPKYDGEEHVRAGVGAACTSLDSVVEALISTQECRPRRGGGVENIDAEFSSRTSQACKLSWLSARDAMLRSARACDERGRLAEKGETGLDLARGGRGRRVEAVETAIAWHEQALALSEPFVPGDGEEQATVACIALCRLYPSRSQPGKLCDSIEDAVRHGKRAYNLSRSGTLDHTASLLHLGCAYSLRSRGGRDRNHALSERFLLKSLSQGALYGGGDAMNAEAHAALGCVYGKRTYGAPDYNLELAGKHYNEAFRCFGQAGLKLRQLDAAVSGGRLLLRGDKYAEAARLFRLGMETAEALGGGVLGGAWETGPAAARSLVSALVRLPPGAQRAYAGCVSACVALGDAEGAFEAAERSLGEDGIASLMRHRFGSGGGHRRDASARNLLNSVQAPGGVCYLSFFEGLWGEMYGFVAECGGKGPASVVQYEREEVRLMGEAARELAGSLQRFRGHVSGGAEHGVDGEAEEAQEACEAALEKASRALRLRCSILPRVPTGVGRLAVSPPGVLVGVPFAALPVDAPGRLCLLDLFQRGVTHTSGARQLSSCAERRKQLPACPPSRLLAVGSPLGTDLAFASHELKSIALRFASKTVTVLQGCSAQEEDISWELCRSSTQPDCVHFACHGRGGGGGVWGTGLLLGSGEVLTVADLLEWRLPRCRLVTLSSCESALPSSSSTNGQSSGLPGAFLASGCPCVVGSLWKVSDASTTALMSKFYEAFKLGDDGDVGAAMSDAMRWLRGARMSEVMEFLPKAARDAWDKDKGRFAAKARSAEALRGGAAAARAWDRRKAMCRDFAGKTGGRDERAQGAKGGKSGDVDLNQMVQEGGTGEGGKGKSEPRAYRGAFSSPFYWAAFVVIGW